MGLKTDTIPTIIADSRRDSEAEIAYNKGRQAVVRMLGKFDQKYYLIVPFELRENARFILE